jgi:DNA primase
VFKCFKCNTQGSIQRLVSFYGNTGHRDKLKLALPYYIANKSYFDKPKVDYASVTCELPEEYFPLSVPRDSFKYRQALEYVLNNRKISMEEIKDYNIGYTEEGTHKLRIIIPSYNNLGKVNYFEARAYWDKITMNYLKPKNPDKNDIIFFESRINWDLPVFLVEGVFDAMRIPNAIPMLGKSPSYYLITKLIEHNSRVVLCLDEDAITDAYEIYEDLSSLGLDMFFVDMTGKADVSKMYEDHGKKAIIELLKTVQKLNFQMYFQKLLKYGK